MKLSVVMGKGPRRCKLNIFLLAAFLGSSTRTVLVGFLVERELNRVSLKFWYC